MKAPKQILNKLDIKTLESISASALQTTDYIPKLQQADKDIKGKTRDILWTVYNKEGFNRFMKVVDNMRTFKGRDFNDVIQVKGEVAEVVLDVIINQFVKEREIADWFIYKGLILGNKNNKKFSTEIDLLLVTPQVVSIFEVKSYNGDKIIFDDCMIRAKNDHRTFEKDAFAQNRVHIKAFWDNFSNCALSKTGVVKSVLFLFSEGDVTDEREYDKKLLMPVFTEKTAPEYLQALFSLNKAKGWEVNTLVKSLDKAQKEARSADDHISYVKSLGHEL